MKVRHRFPPPPRGIPMVRVIRRLRLEPGDVLVVEVSPGCNAQTAHRVAQGIKRVLELAGHADQPTLLMPHSYDLTRLPVEALDRLHARMGEVLAEVPR